MSKKHDRRSLFSILVLTELLLGSMTARPKANDPPEAAEFTFEQYEVVIGSAERTTVLTGFLLGGAIAELAVVHIDESEARRLRIYAFESGTWSAKLDATLRPQVLFVDVAEIGGRHRLITYEHGRLNWFDPESETERELVAVTSNFKPPRRGEIPHVDVTRDMNADGRDDLVVPDVDGFWVIVQSSDGAFANPVKMCPAHIAQRPLSLVPLAGRGGDHAVFNVDVEGIGRGAIGGDERFIKALFIGAVFKRSASLVVDEQRVLEASSKPLSGFIIPGKPHMPFAKDTGPVSLLL